MLVWSVEAFLWTRFVSHVSLFYNIKQATPACWFQLTILSVQTISYLGLGRGLEVINQTAAVSSTTTNSGLSKSVESIRGWSEGYGG
jgi:hypothetical protein